MFIERIGFFIQSKRIKINDNPNNNHQRKPNYKKQFLRHPKICGYEYSYHNYQNQKDLHILKLLFDNYSFTILKMNMSL